MATNRVYKDGDLLSLVCTAPTTPASGDPVLCGQIPGVALAAEEADGKTPLALKGVFDLSAEAVDGSGESAIAVGDIVYYDAAATVKINKDSSNGVRFGYAMEAVLAGATATIQVRVGY